MRTLDCHRRTSGARIATLAALALWFAAGSSPAQETTPVTPDPASQADTAAIGSWDILGEAFPYEAKDVTMQALAKELTQKTGIPVISANLGGTGFAVDNSGGTVRALLDRLEGDGRVLWWWDGGALRLEAPDTTTSALIPLQGVSSDELLSEVRAVGIDEVKYPIMTNPDARFIRVVGPKGYVDNLRELIASIAASKTPEAPVAAAPGLTIIRGRSGPGAVQATPEVTALPAANQVPMQMVPVVPQFTLPTPAAPRTP